MTAGRDARPAETVAVVLQAYLACDIVRLHKLNEDARIMSDARSLHDLSAQAIFDSIRTWDDVRALVERGEPESEHLEFKLFVSGRESSPSYLRYRIAIARTLSAFVNSDGGVLVLGIETTLNGAREDHASAVRPIPNVEGLAPRLQENLPRMIAPAIQIDVRFVQDVSGQGVVLIHVPKGTRGPYGTMGPERNRIFKRRGAQSFLVDMEDLSMSFARQSRPLPSPRPQMGANEKGALLVRYIRSGEPLHIHNPESDSHAPLIFTGAAVPEQTDLTSARLDSAELSKTFLRGVILSQANLVGANLFDADLRSADLRGAFISEANFDSADLTEADLRDAHFGGAIFRRAILTGLNLEGVSLKGDTFDPDVDLLAARWDSISIDGTLYRRQAVEGGEQVLPLGGTNLLRFIFQSREPLSSDELVAARELIQTFGSMKTGVTLLLELAATGERLVIEARGNRELAARIGLHLLQQHQAQRTAIQEEVSRTREQVEGWRNEHAEQLDQVLSVAADIRVTQERLSSDMESFLGKLEPVEVHFPTRKAASDFQKVLAEADLSPPELTFRDRVALLSIQAQEKLGRAVPAISIASLGYLFELLGLRGGFDGGAALAAVWLALSDGSSAKK